MRRVAVINQKGGVGKTTTCVNHGAALTSFGHKVLLLDMDPQANLTLHLDCQPEEGQKTLTDLLCDGTPLAELIRETTTKGLFVVPSDTSLAGVEQVLANRIGRETILSEALDEIKDDGFDFVLIDCPPSLGVLSANGLVAAQEVLIPLQTEYFALQGMAKLMEVIELVKRRLNPELEINCLLPCMVDQRTKLTGEVLAEIGRHFGPLLAQSFIRSNVKLAEAPSFGMTIFQHAPESNGALDHLAFAREFLGMEPLEEEDEEEWEDEELEDLDEDDADEEEEDSDDDAEEEEAEDEGEDEADREAPPAEASKTGDAVEPVEYEEIDLYDDEPADTDTKPEDPSKASQAPAVSDAVEPPPPAAAGGV